MIGVAITNVAAMAAAAQFGAGIVFTGGMSADAMFWGALRRWPAWVARPCTDGGPCLRPAAFAAGPLAPRGAASDAIAGPTCTLVPD
jgi:hypothetical protein